MYNGQLTVLIDNEIVEVKKRMLVIRKGLLEFARKREHSGADLENYDQLKIEAEIDVNKLSRLEELKIEN